MGEILSLPFVGNYLKENKKILKKSGLKDTQTLTLNSFKSAMENAQILAKVLEKKSKSGKKIIIFAHSKACLEVILCLKDHLQLFENYVHRIICVQPPFLGSSLFDEFTFLRPLGVLWPGLKSLRKNFYSDLFTQELVPNIQIQNYLRKSLLVVKGYKDKNISWIIKPSHLFLQAKGHTSDGLVILEDQIIPFAEYKEIVMEIDHSDLFTSTLLSNRKNEFREEMMKSLINWAVTQEDETSIDLKLAEDLLVKHQDIHVTEDLLKVAH